MKAFWILVALALLDAVTLGTFIARRDGLAIVAGVVIITVLLILARRELRLRIIDQRWEAWRTAEANLAARGGGNWRGGDR